jgi:hypothetical protein
MTAELNFVRQQGFKDATAEACGYRYPALMWQPRVIGVLYLVALALQASSYFIALGIVLWWSAAFPDRNPFDAVYTRLVARRKGLPRPDRAPGPRLFAQTLAGGLLIGMGVSLLSGWTTLAWALEAFLAAAIVALVFGRFCFGSFAFLLLTGQAEFVKRTLPWARTESPLSAVPGENRLHAQHSQTISRGLSPRPRQPRRAQDACGRSGA